MLRMRTDGEKRAYTDGVSEAIRLLETDGVSLEHAKVLLELMRESEVPKPPLPCQCQSSIECTGKCEGR